MKAKIAFLLSLATFFSMFPAKASIPECEEWYALIVCASTRPKVFRANSNYLYHILSEHYSFKDIMYLSCHYGDPGVDGPASKSDIREAITDYLKNQVDSDDVVFIWFETHGGGFAFPLKDNEVYVEWFKEKYPLERLEPGDTSDEGWEVMESTLQMDVDGDGSYVGDWVGIDEYLYLETWEEYYWDDELAEDLNSLNCKWLIIGLQSCIGENKTCFSGGFIDDLSAPNRVIITCTNETWFGYADLDKFIEGNVADGFSEFAEGFFNALHGEKAYAGKYGREISHTGIRINADLNGDGLISLWEAWNYAYQHDDARWAVRTKNGQIPDPINQSESEKIHCPFGAVTVNESPWFDDDGDRQPNFWLEKDWLDDNQGSLMKQIAFPPSPKTIAKKCLAIEEYQIKEISLETFPPGDYAVQLVAEFAGYHPENTLNWYLAGGSPHNLLFDGPEGNYGYVHSPPIKFFNPKGTWALSFQTPEGIFSTITADNPDGKKHAKIYQVLPNIWIIGFEDLYNAGDEDYNDMVIILYSLKSEGGGIGNGKTFTTK